MRAVDALVEGAVAGLASYTLLHLVAAPLHWPAWPLTWGWLALSLLVTGTLVIRAVRRPAEDPAPPGPEVPGAPAPPRPLLAAVLGVSVLAAVVPTTAFVWLWAPALLTAAACWWWVSRHARAACPGGAPVPATGREHATALLMSAALAGSMLFVRNPSADDVYYVNRSTWVAERGTFPLQDTMFGAEKLPTPYGSGLPVTSVEELFGALAHLLGLEGAGFVYLVAMPVLVLMSGWVTWRLVESWAVRSRLLVLAVALLLPLFTATGLVGDFGPARMWQGKVIALGVVVPLVWWHLTRLGRSGVGPSAARDRRRSLLVLGVLGVAWCGLTVTAPLFAPPVALAAVVAAVVLPHARRALLLGAAAVTAAPLVTGVATLVVSPEGPVAEAEYIRDAGDAWSRVMGTDQVLVGLLVLGVLAGPLLVRAGTSRVLAATAGLGLFLAAGPGVIALLDAATGAGPIAPRLLLVAPVHVLVALLVTVRLPTPRGAPVRHQGAVLTVLVVALLAGSGTSAWDPGIGASLTDRPTWKVPEEALTNVRLLLAEGPGPGPVLMPEHEMRTLAITTTRTFGVVPRTFYVSLLEEPPPTYAAREMLRRFVDEDRHDPPVGRVRAALVALGVTVACAPADDEVQVATLDRSGFVGRRTVGTMVCFDRPPDVVVPPVTWPGGWPCEQGLPVPGLAPDGGHRARRPAWAGRSRDAGTTCFDPGARVGWEHGRRHRGHPPGQGVREVPGPRRLGPHGARGGGARVPRPERVGQVHHHQDLARHAARDRRNRAAAGRRPVDGRNAAAPEAGLRPR